MAVGDKDHPPREVAWWIAKYVPDLDRKEPRNTGLILRVAESETLVFRFHPQVCRGGVFKISDALRAKEAGASGHIYLTSEERAAHAEQVAVWTVQMEKYGAKCMVWLPKKRTARHFIEIGGSTIKPGRINFEALFEMLVM